MKRGVIMNVGYARVSTGDQNLELQRAALQKAGCDPILTEHASGKAGAERPVRAAMLRDLEHGDTLTVWKLDRLGRSIVELQAILTDLEHRGIKFQSVTENIDTSTAQGRLFFTLLAAFAEFERNLIVERTRAGKAAMIANGEHPGGPRTYGLDVDRATAIEAEADVLREAAKRVLDQQPLAHVVDDFNEREIATRTGGKWHETTLRRMLVSDGLVPAVLDQATHDRLQTLFGLPDERRRMGAPASHLLSGILRCECGAPMYQAWIRDRGYDKMTDEPKHEVYRCARGAGGRTAGCGRVSVRKDTVEPFIVDAVEARVVGPAFADAVNARRAAVLGGPSEVDLDAARAELADYRKLPARFVTAETEARRIELERLIRDAHARLMQAPELQELLDLPQTREEWQQAWAGWDVAQRRHVVKLLLREVKVKPTGRGVRFDGSRLVPDWRV